MREKDRQDKARAYSQEKHMLSIIGIFLSPAILVIFILLGVPSYFKNISAIVSANNYINLIIFSVLIGLFYYLLLLPLDYYSGFVIEHRYLLSNQTFEAWLEKKIKEAAVSFLICMPLVLFVYASIKYYPLYWWVLSGLLWFLLSIVITKLAPVVLVPIFYKYSPIKDAGLRNRLIALCSKAGFRAKGGVYEINMSKDTKKANAALIGMGRQKRIVLCDTLLENFSEDEIESVMAHELGHYRLRHTLRLIIAGGISTFIILFLTSRIFLILDSKLGYSLLEDFESLVLIYAIISVLSIACLPLHNAYSRRLEREADEFSLRITGNKKAFVSTMRKLAEQNLVDTNPPRFYELMLYDHPPITRRISFAESFAKGLS